MALTTGLIAPRQALPAPLRRAAPRSRSSTRISLPAATRPTPDPPLHARGGGENDECDQRPHAGKHRNVTERNEAIVVGLGHRGLHGAHGVLPSSGVSARPSPMFIVLTDERAPPDNAVRPPDYRRLMRGHSRSPTPPQRAAMAALNSGSLSGKNKGAPWGAFVSEVSDCYFLAATAAGCAGAAAAAGAAGGTNGPGFTQAGVASGV